MNTNQQYDEAVETCKAVFLQKTKDYGTSWRVYRTISVADQIYIKAKRIRNIQETGVQKIDDDIIGEFKGILNYGIIGLIQLDIKDDELEELPFATVEKFYNEKVSVAKKLMLDKNHDYGEAWRDMSQESFVDLILAKILRIKQILINKGQTIISEGIDANFYDIVNYAAFGLILIEEKLHRN
jgi:membrane-associated HD superfamily phosphohydrolase